MGVERRMKPISDQHINQAWSDLKSTHGGVLEDYLGLVLLERVQGLGRDSALQRIALGGNDYGVDGFFFDEKRRNLHLYQFKWSKNHALFRQSVQRIIDAGLAEIFERGPSDRYGNELLMRLRSNLVKDQALIERVFVTLVFNGDVESARKSASLESLTEQLLSKQYLVSEYFGREVELMVEYRSSADLDGYVPLRPVKPHSFGVRLGEFALRSGPSGEAMHVGFVPLMDLYRIHRTLGVEFLARNIRASLSDESAPNRSIGQTLRSIAQGKESPEIFCFNHNGVTLGAQKLEVDGAVSRIAHPRLLNGAQTLTTFASFLDRDEGQFTPDQRANVERITVLCRVITGATDAFITSVTINNNRQNPVMPWNLRANDNIQLALQDKFRDEIGIYYERQERMFDSLTAEDVEDLAISPEKPIELLRLARTLLASDGLVDRMNSMREAFEGDSIYNQIFDEKRLNANSRDIVLCYKIEFRLRRLVQHLVEKFPSKYGFLNRARYLVWALLCQAVLNDSNLNQRREDFGEDLAIGGSFVEWLLQLASSRVGVLIKAGCQAPIYAKRLKDERYDFLRSQAFYNVCMEAAGERFGWVRKRLR